MDCGEYEYLARFNWASERDGYQHLYLYETNGRLVNRLTRGEFMVASGVLVTLNNFRVRLDGTKMELAFWE